MIGRLVLVDENGRIDQDFCVTLSEVVTEKVDQNRYVKTKKSIDKSRRLRFDLPF